MPGATRKKTNGWGSNATLRGQLTVESQFRERKLKTPPAVLLECDDEIKLTRRNEVEKHMATGELGTSNSMSR